MELTDFISKYNELKDEEKKDFSRVVLRLLSESYLICDIKEDYDDYYFALSRERSSMIDAYLSIINKKLIIDKDHGIIAVSNINETSSVKLNKRDTVILLILKYLYLEKIKNSKDITSYNVIISINEINNFIRNYQIYRSELKLSQIRDSLDSLKEYKCLNYKMDENGEIKIELYQTINYLVDIKDINELIESFKDFKEYNDETN